MRVLTTATMAVSALAIGLGMSAAQSLAPGGKIASPDAVIQAQQKEGSPSMQNGGGRRGGDGGGMRSGGSQFRSGEKGMRGEGGGQLRYGEKGQRGERGFRGERRGERGYGYRDGRDRRHFRGRGGIYFGPSYGYGPASCAWLRRRALETDSAYWWRRYRACRGW